jgi:hypothetical protein
MLSKQGDQVNSGKNQEDVGTFKTYLPSMLPLSHWTVTEVSPDILRHVWVTAMEAAQFLVAHGSFFFSVISPFALDIPEYVWKYPWTLHCLASASLSLWKILVRIAQFANIPGQLG